MTCFGLLAFGKDRDLQEIIAPTVNIAVTRYPGLTKINELNPSETYIDNKEFDGAAVKQFHDTFSYIRAILPVRGLVEPGTGERHDYLEIPEDAIREALANSIAHRDYSTQASRIQVDIFADRIEIINPGESLIPVSQLEMSHSATRNPLLMTYLKERGIAEQKARGIRTIKSLLKQAGLQPPEFESSKNFFKAVLFTSAFISDEDTSWLKGFKNLKLNSRQLNALAYLRSRPERAVSNKEYRDINNMLGVGDDKKASRDLRRLTEYNILTAIGERKQRKYRIRKDLV